MNKIIEDMLPAENGGVGMYIYTRNDEEFKAVIALKNGVFSEGVGVAVLPSAKPKRDDVANFYLAKKILQPHPHSPIVLPDMDIESMIDAVDQQNLFLTLLMDRLNNPDVELQPIKNTWFDVRAREVTYVFIDQYISKENLHSLKGAQALVPKFELCRNNGTGNYQQFMDLYCLPAEKENFKTAIISAVYDFEYTLNQMAASRNNPQMGNKPDASEPT